MPQVLGAYFEPSLGKHSRLSSDLSINQKAEMISIIIVFTKWITVRKGRWKNSKILEVLKEMVPHTKFFRNRCIFSLFIDLRIIQICWKITKLFWNLWFLENIDLNLRNYFFFVFLQRKSPEGTLKKIEFYLGKNTVLDNLLLKKKASPSPYLEWRRLTLESIKVEFFWKGHKIWKKNPHALDKLCTPPNSEIICG